MSDIELSPQLFQDIKQAVGKQHPDADTGVMLQYLAAVTGYLVGSDRSMDQAAKKAFMQDLCGFAEHVYNDTQGRQQQQTAAATAKAFGYWNPPKH